MWMSKVGEWAATGGDHVVDQESPSSRKQGIPSANVFDDEYLHNYPLSGTFAERVSKCGLDEDLSVW
jgi:hypothetical protein